MSKTLKIFLYSLVGALVGVIGFGAISSVTRGEDKKEETKTETEEIVQVPFETFMDDSLYTTREVKVGDNVSGKYIRLFADNSIGFNEYDIIFGMLISDFGDFNFGKIDEAPIIISDLPYNTYEKNEIPYIDVFFAPGTYEVETFNGTPKPDFVIGENLTIVNVNNVNGIVVELIPNR